MGTRKDFLDLRDTHYAPSGDTGFNSGHPSDAPDGERRDFLFACSVALASAAAQISTAVSAQIPAQGSTVSTGRGSVQQAVKYANSILTDEHGQVFKASAVKPLTNYLFHYPYIATPCLMLNLGRDVGGAGRGKSIVAFSAICSHKLAYPAREVSFIRFQAKASSRSEAERIHCCADHSVYDPARGASVVTGPAPVALATVLLEFDAKTDSLKAVGVSGVDQFDAFFAKYDFKLSMEFGNRARSAVAGTTRLQELTQFCRNVAQC
jgi:arsenite oxidase small subunit